MCPSERSAPEFKHCYRNPFSVSAFSVSYRQGILKLCGIGTNRYLGILQECVSLRKEVAENYLFILEREHVRVRGSRGAEGKRPKQTPC